MGKRFVGLSTIRQELGHSMCSLNHALATELWRLGERSILEQTTDLPFEDGALNSWAFVDFPRHLAGSKTLAHLQSSND